MDLTFQTEGGRFNCRAAAVILDGGRLLAMRDGHKAYDYLPGGRVRLHEPADHAVLRELHGELGIEAEIVRALWLCQSFFVEDVSRVRYHKLGFYFLVDISKTDLLSRGEAFLSAENGRDRFEWLPLDRLESAYLYPKFIKKSIFSLPERLEIVVEQEIGLREE